MKTRLMLLSVVALMSCGENTAKEEKETVQGMEIKDFDDLVDASNVSPDSLDRILIKSRKPVILYFSGYACVNARKIEEEILVYAKNNTAINERVIVKFMVDEKTPLPKNEKYFSHIAYDSVSTVGKRGIEMQQMFRRNDQPCF